MKILGTTDAIDRLQKTFFRPGGVELSRHISLKRFCEQTNKKQRLKQYMK